MLWTPLAFVGIRAFRRGAWRLLSPLAALLSVFCILVWRPETSRFAYLAALAILGLVWRVWIRRRPLGVPYPRVVAVCLAILGATILFFERDRVQAEGVEFKTNLAKYDVVWNGEFQIFLEHPIWGGGPGSTLILFPEFRSPDYHLTGYVSTVTVYPNNLVVRLLAEVGVAGTICFLWFVAGALAGGLKIA